MGKGLRKPSRVGAEAALRQEFKTGEGSIRLAAYRETSTTTFLKELQLYAVLSVGGQVTAPFDLIQREPMDPATIGHRSELHEDLGIDGLGDLRRRPRSDFHVHVLEPERVSPEAKSESV